MHEPQNPIESSDDGCVLHLYARPRASRTKIAGLHDGRIKLQVAAPPVDGEANVAIVAFLSSALGVAKSMITITSGHSGKRKSVHVAQFSADEALDKLGLASTPKA